MSGVGEIRAAPGWSRFSIVDCAILVASFALGAGMVHALIPDGPETDDPLRRGALIGLGLLFSCAFIGPLVLAGQWMRGRRVLPGWGELAGLIPISLASIIAVIAWALNVPSMSAIAAWIGIQLSLSLMSLFCFFWGLRRPSPGAECRWGDPLGYLACAGMAPLCLIVAGGLFAWSC